MAFSALLRSPAVEARIHSAAPCFCTRPSSTNKIFQIKGIASEHLLSIGWPIDHAQIAVAKPLGFEHEKNRVPVRFDPARQVTGKYTEGTQKLTCLGNSIVKMHPDPGLSRTLTLPLMASTLRLQMSKPKPMPDRLSPRRTNGLNRVSTALGGRPPQ